MKLTLERISLLAIATQRYLPMAMMVLSLALVLISPDSPEKGGGIGG